MTACHSSIRDYVRSSREALTSREGLPVPFKNKTGRKEGKKERRKEGKLTKRKKETKETRTRGQQHCREQRSASAWMIGREDERVKPTETRN